MSSTQFTFSIEPAKAEILLALLTELPFDAFEEKDGQVLAYASSSIAVETVQQQLEELQQRLSFQYVIEELPDQNWNKLWEDNFSPIIVDRFCGIRADFHDPIPEVKFEIRIQPKMAFGTGHHATTRMMIQMMRDQLWTREKVLDFGCGTGILAILASKMGALMVDAVDIERPAYDNTIENCQVNEVHNVQVLLGGINVVIDQGYDIILANINRNVILDSLETLYVKLKKGGSLLISGILNQDEDLVLKKAKGIGFTIDERKRENGWSCITLIS